MIPRGALMALLTLLTAIICLGAENRVLKLTGEGHLQLPDNILKDFTEGTVEAWVSVERTDGVRRVFNFGEFQNDMGLGTPWVRNFGIEFFICSNTVPMRAEIRAPIVPGDWQHVAAVSGADGMKIYFNGALVGVHEFKGSFASVAPTTLLIGAAHRGGGIGLEQFVGMIDEFRIWKVARSENQIRETMSRNLDGSEPGLVALLSFDGEGDAYLNDSGPSKFPVRAIGSVSAVLTNIPSATPLIQERVLELDGDGSFVTLPDGIVRDGSSFTLEAWAKWRSFKDMARLIDVSTENFHFNIQNRGTAPTLFAEVIHSGGSVNTISAPNVLRTDDWMHVAFVAQIGANYNDASNYTLRLYLNGVLIASQTQPVTGINTAPFTRKNFIGFSNAKPAYPADREFDGRLDEVRVWTTARNDAEITSNMFRTVAGNEPGLAGYWRFDNAAEDSSIHKRNGSFSGAARTVVDARPAAGEVQRPAIITGVVRDSAGKGVPSVTVNVVSGGVILSSAVTSSEGAYILPVLHRAPHYDFSASTADQGAWVTNISIAPGSRLTQDFTLANAVSIEGSITDFGGSFSDGVIVQAIEADAPAREVGTLMTPGLVATTVTSANTPPVTFRFSHLRPGRYRVAVHTPEGIVLAGGGPIDVIAGRTAKADLRLRPVNTLRGRRFSSAQGLPGIIVTDLDIDSRGVLWMSTQNGVAQYDGANFVSYQKRDGLPDLRAACVHASRDGFIWIGSEEGLTRLEPNSGATTIFNARNSALPAGRVFDVDSARDGALWVRTRAGLARYDGKSFTTVPGIPPLRQDSTLRKSDALAIDRAGRVWTITQSDDFFMVDGTNVTRFAQKDGLGGNSQDAVFADREGSIWFNDFFRGGEWLTRHRDGRFEKVRASEMGDPTFVSAIHQAPDGRLYFGHGNGLITQFDPAIGSYVRLRLEPAISTRIHAMITDHDGGLWVASLNGLFHFPIGTFESFTKADGLADERLITGARLSDGTLLFGGQSFFVHRAKNSPSSHTEPHFNAHTNGLAGNLYKFMEDRSSNVWIASESGLLRLSPAPSRSLQRITGPFLSGITLDFAPDPQTNYVDIAKWGVGVVRMDLNQTSWENPLAERMPGISNFVGVLFRDSHNAIWFSGKYRATSFGRIVGSSIDYFDPAAVDGMVSDRVLSFAESRDGSIYVGGESGVLIYKDGQFSPVESSVLNTAPRTFVPCISRDANDVLWFGSEQSVYRFDGIAWSVLDEQDGLDVGEVTSFVHDDDGRVWISGVNGLTAFTPSVQKPHAPLITIKTSREYTAKELPDLLPDQLVSLRFRAVDFKTAQTRRIYRTAIINGNVAQAPAKTDAAWQAPSTSTQLDFSPTAPGQYTFFVQFIDRDLNYSEPGRALLTVVASPLTPAAVAARVGGGIFVALAPLVFIFGNRYYHRRKEAERLRKQILEHEQEARAALERKNKELEKAMDAAESASKTKSQFLATMSHELRTPLNAILGYSELLEEELADRQDVVPDLRKIHGAGKHLLGLINDILDLSKIEAGKMTVYIETFNIEETVSDVANTVKPLIAQRGNKLRVDIDPGLGEMRGDLTKVRQALLNLLSNAAKFTENGQITLKVEAARSGEVIDFSVSDTGIGMTSEQISRLFEAFSQADASTSRKYGGTGLGLALTRSFCRLMGGDVDVTSAQGQGSTFKISLPRWAQDEARAAAAASVTSANGATGPAVLVIDDEATARDLIERSLRKAGYRIFLASDPREGLRLAREQQPDVITLDVMMPVMDGWAVLTALKGDASTRDIPVVMVSMVNEKNLGISLGATDYLTKPIDWSRLLEVVKRHTAIPAARTLVIEDDAVLREMVRRTLEKSGCVVDEAGNGRLGLRALEKSIPDVILLDLMMPEMDGFEFMHELRRSPLWRHVPVIVITSKDLSEEERAHLNSQVSQVLQKGAFSVEELLAEIQKAAAISRRKPHQLTSF